MVKAKNGFTVIEVLLGVALFGLVMPVIIYAVTSIAAINDRTADLIRANIVAEEKFESLRSAGFNSLTDGTTNFESELDASFSIPRDAFYVVSTPEAGVRRIDVTIEYTDRGLDRNLKYSSVISELGVAQ